VLAIVTGSGRAALVNEASAVAHLKSQILDGTWAAGNAGQANNFAMITFFRSDSADNGTYLMAVDGDPAARPNGQDGIERGTYAWYPASGALTATAVVDTNGQWGLSHPAGAMTLQINGDTLTVSDGTSNMTFTRVPYRGSGRVGGSLVHQAFNGVPETSFSVVTFFNDGTYALAEDSDPAGKPNGQDGIETGTYTETQTGLYSASITVSPVTDTNGQWGLSHPRGVRTFTATNGDFELRESESGCPTCTPRFWYRQGPY
jgi:hypothetical protein